MRATILLVDVSGLTDITRGLRKDRESVVGRPRVAVWGPVRIGSHDALPVGWLRRSWVGPDGSTYAEAEVAYRHEQAFRDAVVVTRACSLEVVPVRLERIIGTGAQVSVGATTQRTWWTIEGVVVGVVDPDWPGSRIVTMDPDAIEDGCRARHPSGRGGSSA